MNMFDDLDPLFEPSTTAALENVAVRVRQLRKRRRMTIVGSIGTVALVTALATGAFASGASGHPRVSVSDDSTTSSTVTAAVARARGHKISGKPGSRVTTSTAITAATSAARSSATTVTSGAQAQSTSTPGATTGPAATLPLPTPTTGPTPTTVPHTPAAFRVAFATSHLTLQSGTTTSISYVIANVGGSTGYLDVDPCTSDNPQELWPTPRGLWPASIQPRVMCGVLQHVPLAPGASAHFTHLLVAGQFSGPNIVPAYPGAVAFTPPELPVPAATAAPARSLPVTVTAPATAPFSSNRPTQVTAAPGKQVLAPFALSNNLPFPVAFGFVGPQTTPRQGTTAAGPSRAPAASATGSCAAQPVPHHFTVWQCRYTVAGNTTVSLELDFWATDTLLPPTAVIDPPSPTAVLPLPPGTYVIPWNEIALRLVVT